MIRSGQLPVALIASLLVAGCGGGQKATTPLETRSLEESKALEIVVAAIAERGFQQAGPVKVELGNKSWLECDVSVAGEKIAVEYLTEQDRREVVDIPPPAQGSRLHVIPARLEPAQPGLQGDPIYVYIIDDRKYVYQYNPTSDRRADVTLGEVEDRLTRDLDDFLTWYEGTKAQAQ
ncbi:MAG TPA: hypothetical protein VM285_13415 [Polyangia bacterium]|nr:hypothetical protein [Polyangia bacterium]